ncbi:MAG: phosphoribosylamine--glycine ligase [Bacteroidota bacterium]
MNVLIIGSGGREHALSWKIAQSPSCDQLFIVPGNAGTEAIGTNVDIDPLDFDKVNDFVKDKLIDLLVVGPEEPLVKGITDFFKVENPDLKVVGPTAEGAILEGSKDYAKEFMKEFNIPTAGYQTFSDEQISEARQYLDNSSLPIVLKADGLAAGKGVIICETQERAFEALDEILAEKKFGEAGSKLVIEEFLRGIELSVFVLTDGTSYIVLPEAKDYKRIGEGDTGPNTGGMGAISPVPFAKGDFLTKVEKEVIIPTIQGLKSRNIDYKGFIFFGLMNVNGNPYVIEYNVRMGDPETQVVLPRLEGDFLDALVKTADGKADKIDIKIVDKTASTVVLVSKGYPGSYEKHKMISFRNEDHSSVKVFHAGTIKKNQDILTNGGRVLAVTGLGNNIDEAINQSYHTIKKIDWYGMTYRSDIGFDLK